MVLIKNWSKIIKKIAVFIPNKPFFGALMVQLPFFHLLRQKYPEAKIRIYSCIHSTQVFLDYHLADEIEYYDRKKAKLSLFRSLWKFRADLVFNLRPISGITNLIIGLSNAKIKIGFANDNMTSLLYTKRVTYSREQYVADSYLQLLDLVFPLPNNKFSFFDELVTDISPQRYVCFLPGGGEGEHKKWGIDNFLSLADRMYVRDHDLQFAFILGSSEENYLESISKHKLCSRFKILMNETVAGLVTVLKQSELVVSNDCGPSHIAQMLGVNYVGVWGWVNQCPLVRIGEWTVKKENSLQLMPDQGLDIKLLNPEVVFNRICKKFKN